MDHGGSPYQSLAQEQADFNLYPDSPHMFSFNHQYSHAQLPANLDPSFAYPRYVENPVNGDFNAPSMYPDMPTYQHNSPEMQQSTYSSVSGPSATSSAMGSPHSIHAHNVPAPEWAGLTNIGGPAIAGHDNYTHTDYNSFQNTGTEDFAHLEYTPAKPLGFVDPSILHPQQQYLGRPSSASHESSAYPPPPFTGSPALSHVGRSPRPVKQGSQSPYLNTHHYHPYPQQGRRRSLSSHQSYGSPGYSGDDMGEKGRCPEEGCGKVFKDLKAHMLTHQSTRPEKCPITTCDYHRKGFARKYDKNRHTLTHYKGTMVCGFCPGSGSSAEKSFNRADVFKRHLTSVHAVEQSPPNSRKKTSGSINTTKKLLTGYAPDATGKCSTCSNTFSNAQDFYEHLDECVLRTVQQEEPSEAINAARLAEVESDEDVHETLRNNSLPIKTTTFSADEDDDEDDLDDENDDDFSLNGRSSRKGRGNRNPANGVQKSRGLTHSKGGVPLNTKGRKKRKDYPGSWGAPITQMKMKKRVLCVFDGQRRLWKDDMMLNGDYEVRLKLQDEKSYVTDLDVQTMRRADAFHNADEAEKGPWISDDLTGVDLEKLMEHETPEE